MPNLIEPDQAGFIQTRQCGDNTNRILHLIDKAHQTHMDAPLLTVDAEKVFDRVDWRFLEQTMAHFGLGDRFQEWVGCCNGAPTASMRVNGISSHPFVIQRGTRQGCPLLPLLFALYIEPLAQKIRDNPNIKGIPFWRGSTPY